MRLANWFKITWWVALATAITWFLAARVDDLVAGYATPADVVVFLVWVALLLTPIFQEIEFFGLKFKQEVQKLKEELKIEIHSVRAELRNAVDVRTTFSPQFTWPAPTPDAQLPDLEARINKAVADALAGAGIRQPSPVPADLAVPDEVAFLFATRYALERELRNLARDNGLEEGFRRVGGLQLARGLGRAGVIDSEVARAVQEIYAVSSAAVHAEEVSEAKVSFVRDVGPTVVGALRALQRSP